MGAKVELASQIIGPSGGTIAISKPGDSLDGFVINIPTGAYPDNRTFKVSSAPITKQSFGNDITPISPMITVDNGGGYSDELMYVRVPVRVPEGNFAMGFIYDAKTKQLEGLPMSSVDAESVTVATMHFSNFFVSMIEKSLLKKDINSGFCPGIDDWQFTNYGSYIAPGGHCEGQSLTAMWYYCVQPDGKDQCLYNRYDNNGQKPATPDLWEDDSLGYRFCSVIQEEKRFDKSFWMNLGGKEWKKVNNKWQLTDVPGIGDENTFNLFSYSIRATGEPQEVAIWSNAGSGHAMVVDKIVGNTLYIADPNYPGKNDRKIIYDSTDNKFKPYNSGANKKEIDAGNGIAFETIIYQAKSTIVPWDKIANRWTEFKNKTIGNDKFPDLTITYKDDKGQWQELKDGYVSPVKLIIIAPSETGGLIRVYRDGKELKLDNQGNLELNPGNNKLGIYIMKKVLDDNEYVDFKYFNVTHNVLSIDPASLAGAVNTDYTFTAKVESPPDKARYEWKFQDGTAKGNTVSHRFSKEGTYTITLKLYDDTKNELAGQATATAVIKAAIQPPHVVASGNLKKLQEFTMMQALINGVLIINRTLYDPHGVVSQQQTRKRYGFRIPYYGISGERMPIVWNGTSFTGKLKDSSSYSPLTGPGENIDEIIGTVSEDGNTIKSLIYTFKNHVGAVSVGRYEATDLRMELVDLPINWNPDAPPPSINCNMAGYCKDSQDFTAHIKTIEFSYRNLTSDYDNVEKLSHIEWGSTDLLPVHIIGFCK